MSEKKTPFDLLHGKKVVIQSNQGIIYIGTFGGLYEDYFILTDGQIIGRKNIAYADFILLKKAPSSTSTLTLKRSSLNLKRLPNLSKPNPNLNSSLKSKFHSHFKFLD